MTIDNDNDDSKYYSPMSRPLTDSSPRFCNVLQKLMRSVSLYHRAVFTRVQLLTRPSPDTKTRFFMSLLFFNTIENMQFVDLVISTLYGSHILICLFTPCSKWLCVCLSTFSIFYIHSIYILTNNILRR